MGSGLAGGFQERISFELPSNEAVTGGETRSQLRVPIFRLRLVEPAERGALLTCGHRAGPRPEGKFAHHDLVNK